MDWYHTWFNDDYLALYPHRDAADAVSLVALIGAHVSWDQRWRVLDVGCGPGRHAAALEDAGIECIGLDLSMVLLRRARTVTRAPLVRADMRVLPVRDGSMDAVLSLFTSFGYFADDAEHRRTLRGMATALRPEGWLVLDFLGAGSVREAVAAVAGQVLVMPGGAEVSKRISADGRFVFKDIRLPSGAVHQERVRLFSPDELARMLEASGLTVRHAFGDYEGSAIDSRSPRALFLAQAA